MIVTVDLWNTLVRVSPENARFLSTYLSERAPRKGKDVRTIIGRVGLYFDNLGIETGRETPSRVKLQQIIDETGADTTVDEMEQGITADLIAHRPVVIDPDGLVDFDEHLARQGTKWYVASNSGLVGARIMRDVVETDPFLGGLKSYGGAYFSEEIGYAKPATEFFDAIEDATGDTIRLHIGDHPVSDYKAKIKGNTAHVHPDNTHDPANRRFQDFRQLAKSLAHLLK